MRIKDHYVVIPPAPTVGIVIVAERLRIVPAHVWQIWDTRAGVAPALVWEGKP